MDARKRERLTGSLDSAVATPRTSSLRPQSSTEDSIDFAYVYGNSVNGLNTPPESPDSLPIFPPRTFSVAHKRTPFSLASHAIRNQIVKMLSLWLLFLVIWAHLSRLSHPAPLNLATPPSNTNSTCPLDSLPTPLRILSLNSSSSTPPYKLFLHPPGSDTFLSDALWDSTLAHLDPFRSPHARFLSAAQKAKERYGSLTGVIAMDIGAHIGIHSTHLASLGFDVKAWEPHPVSSTLLSCAAGMHPGPGKIEVDSRAVVAKEGEEGFLDVPFPENAGHAVLVPKPTRNSFEVSTVSVASIVASLSAPPWLVKLSTEGTEPGLLSALLRDPSIRPAFIFSALPRPLPLGSENPSSDPVALFRSLFEGGYRVFLSSAGGSTPSDALANCGVQPGDVEVVLGLFDLREISEKGGEIWAFRKDLCGG